MPQINISISFHPKNDSHLLTGIEEGNRSANIKAAISFWLEYRHLLPQLNDTSDLLSVVMEMASKQSLLLDRLESLSRQLNGLEKIPETIVVDEEWSEDMLDVMEDFE